MKVRIDLFILIIGMIFLYINKLNTYFLILFFTLFHEIAHIVVGIILGYKIEKTEILTIGMSIKFKNKVEGYNKRILNGNLNNIEKIIIAFAGPLFNFIIVIILLLLSKYNIYNINTYDIKNLEQIIYINLMLGIFNLIPIYPLDGYIIVLNVLSLFIGNIKSKKYIYYISNIIIFIITVLTSILILKYKNIWLLVILAFLYYLNIRENKRYMAKKRLYNKYEELKKYI